MQASICLSLFLVGHFTIIQNVFRSLSVAKEYFQWLELRKVSQRIEIRGFSTHQSLKYLQREDFDAFFSPFTTKTSKVLSSNDTVFIPELINKKQMYSVQWHEIFWFHQLWLHFLHFYHSDIDAGLPVSCLIWSADFFWFFFFLILTLVEQSLFSIFC